MKYLKWISNNTKSLSGKTILITGANSGLGFATSLYLAKLNANLVFACRNIDKAKDAKEKILKEVTDAKIEIFKYDQSSFDSIDEFIEKVKDLKIYALILNAGVYYPKANYKTKDNLELTIGTNYFGTFHLVEGLKESLKRNHSILVFVTSLTATTISKKYQFKDIDKMNRNKLYGFSKLCVSRYAKELSKDKELSIRVVHPGITATNILNGEQTGFPNLFSKVGHDFLYLFVHSVFKASLNSVLAVCNECEDNKNYIAPRGLFAISGYPKRKKIPKYTDVSIIDETMEYLKEKK